jgi:hypothetical protein
MLSARGLICSSEWLFPNPDYCDTFNWSTDWRSQLKLDHGLPKEGTGGFRTARWNLLLQPAQSQAPESQAAPLRVDEEIHAGREALLASEGRSDP